MNDPFDFQGNVNYLFSDSTLYQYSFHYVQVNIFHYTFMIMMITPIHDKRLFSKNIIISYSLLHFFLLNQCEIVKCSLSLILRRRKYYDDLSFIFDRIMMI
jgi:hypothetical protein